MFAGPRRLYSDAGVEVVRGGDDHCLHVRVGQQIAVIDVAAPPELRHEFVQRRAVRPAGGNQPDFRQLGDGRRVLRAIRSGPDDPDVQHERVSFARL